MSSDQQKVNIEASWPIRGQYWGQLTNKRPAHPELGDSDPVYDDPLPGVHGSAGPRPAAPRMPDAGHAVLSVPGALTRHTLHTSQLFFLLLYLNK